MSHNPQMATNVKKLEKSVQSQLRSDLTTHSVTNCIIELVENAIDAQSTSIVIRVNLQKFQIQVIDNGTGMAREQLKTVGKRNCTSKWESKSKPFGYRGESLANIRKSCDRLLIITRTAETGTTFCKEFHNDGSPRIEEALQERMSKGTTVVVKNILGKTPVRQARIIPSREFQGIKQYIRATAIMHPLICFSFEDSAKSVELLRIKRARTVSKQLKNLYPEVYDNSTLLRLVAESGSVRIKAVIGDRMCKFKTVQFVFVNKRYVAKSEVEKLFKKLLQKCFRDLKMKEALEVRSRWQPVFVLNITCPENEYYLLSELSKRYVEFKNRHVVNHCLVKLSNEFRRTLGLEKMSMAPSNGSKTTAKNKSTFTFIHADLFKKFKDATTVFGISTTRSEVHRYRHSHYQVGMRELKEVKRSYEKRFGSDLRDEKVLPEQKAEDVSSGVARWLEGSRHASAGLADDEEEDSFERIFREPKKPSSELPPDTEEASAATKQVSEVNEDEPRASIIGDEHENEHKPAQVAVVANPKVNEEAEDIFYRPPGEDKEKPGHFQFSVSSGKVDEDEDIFYQPRVHGPKKLGHSPIKNRIFGATYAEINDVENPLPGSANNSFDNTFTFTPQGEMFTTPTLAPALPTVMEEDVFVEDAPQDSSLLASSVVRMLMNCSGEYSEDREEKRNSFSPPSQPTKKIILRDSKLKFHGPLDVEFALKPTNKTFVNYVEKRSTRVEFTPESCPPAPGVNHQMDGNMMELTFEPHFDHHEISPDCRCSCHQNIGGAYANAVQSNMSESQTPATNLPACLPEENPYLDSELRDFSFTPYVASPYFNLSASVRGNEDKLEDVPPTSGPHDAMAINECRNSPVLHVVGDFSFKTLRKKMKFKRNCKILSTTGAIDVPSGMLEASRPSNRKSVALKPVGNNLLEIMKPYSVRNHYTLDDNGQSCLRLFPHLRKSELAKTNSLTISEELNSSSPFTKPDLRNIKFLAQVDQKFLLTTMRIVDQSEEMIVMFDQHAVDERIRLEQLFETYTDENGIWRSTFVNPAIYPGVTTSDLPILRDFQTHFEEKGLYFKFNRGGARSTQRYLMAVVKVPACLHNKALRESSSSEFGSKLTELVESLIKEMVELLSKSQCPVQNIIPDTLCRALNYEACRGAIKFGDELSEKVCESLLKKLSNCECPFQCAHGRPVLAPLMSLTKIEASMTSRSSTKKSLDRLANMFGVLL